MKHTLELVVILCGTFLVSTSGVKATSHKKDDDATGFEFGRRTSQRSKGRKLEQVEIFVRELLDEDLLAMSMSMSMSMSLPPQAPTRSPKATPTAEVPAVTTEVPAPTAEVSSSTTTTSPEAQGPRIVDNDFTSSSASCNEQAQTAVTLDLEVETAIGKATFSTDVAQALKNALIAGGFSFCASPRGLKNKRRLQSVPILIGDVAVVEDEAGSCEVQSELADQCRFARLDISVSGGEGVDVVTLMEESIQTILDDDTDLDDTLLTEGIVNVRLRDESSSAPRAALTSGGTSPAPGSPATTAVVTIAATAAIVVAALALRRSRRKGAYENLDAKDGDGQSYTNTAAGTTASSTAVAI